MKLCVCAGSSAGVAMHACVRSPNNNSLNYSVLSFIRNICSKNFILSVRLFVWSCLWFVVEIVGFLLLSAV